MTIIEIENMKYPIGKRKYNGSLSPAELAACLNDIETLPVKLRKEVENLSQEQLDTPYRPGGWTVRQVVHHFADSHMNAFIRHKLCITENNPTIKPYMENLWAMQSDVEKVSIASSLMILEGVHLRWSVLLESLNESDFAKTFVHPEHNKIFKLEESIGQYAWHGNHHLEHIKQAKKFKGVFNFKWNQPITKKKTLK